MSLGSSSMYLQQVIVVSAFGFQFPQFRSRMVIHYRAYLWLSFFGGAGKEHSKRPRKEILLEYHRGLPVGDICAIGKQDKLRIREHVRNPCLLCSAKKTFQVIIVY